MNVNKMMNLYNIANSINYDLPNNVDKNTLYSNLKIMANYINGELSKMNKSELIKFYKDLNFYVSNKSEYESNQFKFKSKIIELSKEQERIVKSDPAQHQRILAGAGSGKTTTILCRIKFLLDHWICPDRILILTFNRDSAQSIKNRLNDLFGFNINLNVYTIDAFCCKLMHLYGHNSIDGNSNLNTNTYGKITSLSEYSHIGLDIMHKYGKEISNQYTHVFFDEFQDVNDIQFAILKIFVNNSSYLTVIGDDCQNIYQFRGTNNYWMVNFDTIIPNSNTFKLESNYRSTNLIVNMANDSIGWNANRVDKKMVGTNPDNDFTPQLVICGKELHKYDYIVKKIKTYIEQGYSYGQIAILSRNSYPLKQMEAELTRCNLPMVSLITDKNSDDNKKLLEPNKIALTTIFKSKGLEFDIVFIIGLAHQHFPSHMNNNIKNIEEERRLFYVGITRCKKYLYMIGNKKEFPLSIFLNEIKSHVKIFFYKCKKMSRNKIFIQAQGDENKLKLTYGVNELVGSLKPEDYQYLRTNNLIIDMEPIIVKIFNNKLFWSNNISKGAFEPDIGEFTDRYITRGICIGLNIPFTDVDTNVFIEQNNESLSMDELEKLFNSTDTQLKEINENSDENSIKLKLTESTESTESTNLADLADLDLIDLTEPNEYINPSTSESCSIKKFIIPFNVLERIKLALSNCIDPTKLNQDIKEDIYWISLCRNFLNERLRLVWKNIYNLVEENIFLTIESNELDKSNDNLFNRMEYYIKKYCNVQINSLPKCKISMMYRFKNLKRIGCAITGESDFIYSNGLDSNGQETWTLIDFKCSQSDFKLEWQIQLLCYYSLMKQLGIYSNLNITKIGIINIMNGEEYYFGLAENYNYLKLIEFLKRKIELEQQSIRTKPNMKLILPCVDTSISINSNRLVSNNIPINLNFPNKNYSMVLDTETTELNGDIIQIAWVLVQFDIYGNHTIIKQFNKLVKDRIPTSKSIQIHKIDINKIRTFGEDFYNIIQDFIQDLQQTHTIIGHNISFDLRIILNNLRKFGIGIIDEKSNQMIFNLFDNFNIVCTKKLNGGGTLEQMHMNLEKTQFDGAHDALYDVLATLRCYSKLIQS